MKKARQKSARTPAASPMPTTAGIIISLLGTNNLVFQHLLPLAEAELATVFPLDGFETEHISNAVERMAKAAHARFPNADDNAPWNHADAGFVLGLVAGLRIGGAR